MLPPRAIPANLSVASLVPAWRVPRYFILARPARLSLCSMPYVNTPWKRRKRRKIPVPIFTVRDGFHLESCPSHAALQKPAQKKMPPASIGMPEVLADGPLHATIGPWLPKPLARKAVLRFQRARQNWRPSPVRFCIAYASSATTCFAFPPISSMQSSAPPVTKADPRCSVPGLFLSVIFLRPWRSTL